MRHAGDSNELLEIACDELWSVVRDDARLRFRVLFLGSFENDLDVGFLHRLPQIPMNDATAKRKFRPLLRAFGIQVPRGNGFHAFGHANATLMNSFEASQKLRQQRLGHADGSAVADTIYTHVISEDGKRIAAQLGNAVWGILYASWTEKGNGPEGASSKPFVIN